MTDGDDGMSVDPVAADTVDENGPREDAQPPGSPLPADIAVLPYELARDELAGIVARLEGGQLGLEDSMSLWERGEQLARHCSALLDGAQARITVAAQNAAGNHSADGDEASG